MNMEKIDKKIDNIIKYNSNIDKSIKSIKEKCHWNYDDFADNFNYPDPYPHLDDIDDYEEVYKKWLAIHDKKKTGVKVPNNDHLNYSSFIQNILENTAELNSTEYRNISATPPPTANPKPVVTPTVTVIPRIEDQPRGIEL